MAGLNIQDSIDNIISTGVGAYQRKKQLENTKEISNKLEQQKQYQQQKDIANKLTDTEQLNIDKAKLNIDKAKIKEEKLLSNMDKMIKDNKYLLTDNDGFIYQPSVEEFNKTVDLIREEQSDISSSVANAEERVNAYKNLSNQQPKIYSDIYNRNFKQLLEAQAEEDRFNRRYKDFDKYYKMYSDRQKSIESSSNRLLKLKNAKLKSEQNRLSRISEVVNNNGGK